MEANLNLQRNTSVGFVTDHRRYHSADRCSNRSCLVPPKPVHQSDVVTPSLTHCTDHPKTEELPLLYQHPRPVDQTFLPISALKTYTNLSRFPGDSVTTRLTLPARHSLGRRKRSIPQTKRMGSHTTVWIRASLARNNQSTGYIAALPPNCSLLWPSGDSS